MQIFESFLPNGVRPNLLLRVLALLIVLRRILFILILSILRRIAVILLSRLLMRRTLIVVLLIFRRHLINRIPVHRHLIILMRNLVMIRMSGILRRVRPIWIISIVMRWNLIIRMSLWVLHIAHLRSRRNVLRDMSLMNNCGIWLMMNVGVRNWLRHRLRHIWYGLFCCILTLLDIRMNVCCVCNVSVYMHWYLSSMLYVIGMLNWNLISLLHRWHKLILSPLYLLNFTHNLLLPYLPILIPLNRLEILHYMLLISIILYRNHIGLSIMMDDHLFILIGIRYWLVIISYLLDELSLDGWVIRCSNWYLLMIGYVMLIDCRGLVLVLVCIVNMYLLLLHICLLISHYLISLRLMHDISDYLCFRLHYWWLIAAKRNHNRWTLPPFNIRLLLSLYT